MEPLTFPNDTRDVVDAMRKAIGRTVFFYTETVSGCSACNLDPITNTSTNPYCVVCSGQHWIHTFTSKPILGHITWSPSETLNWVSGGQLIDGDVRVQIEYTPSNISVLEDTEYVIVDGKRCLIRHQMFRGVPELNRILIDLRRED